MNQQRQRTKDATALPPGDVFARVQSAAHASDTSPYSRRQPTPAQLDANRYSLGRVRVHGLALRIENPHGTRREGVGADGRAWSNLMPSHYGDIEGTHGADGDPVDVFIGPLPERDVLWVVNQIDPGTGEFDEHKVMLGYASEQQARDAYACAYDRQWRGLKSIVKATVSQLKWWLKFGDKSRPFTPDVLPYESTSIMDKVLWNNQAQPVTETLNSIMYGLRKEDAGHDLMVDAVSMADLMSDPDIEAVQVLDAMVVEVGRMQPKMEALQRIMATASELVKPTEMTISAPVRYRGVAQVMALFTMSDGQTVSIWFHNPDTTPAKLMPLDELISWKWMLNKKDVTIVVAPEKGRDLNPREVARRVMRLVERNSEAFQRVNAKVAERAAQLEALDTEIAELETELTDLQRQIEVAKVEAEGRNAAPAPAPVVPPAPTPDPDPAPNRDQSPVIVRANAIADRLIAFFGWKKSSENEYPELAAMLDSPRGTNWVLLEEKGGRLAYDGAQQILSYLNAEFGNAEAVDAMADSAIAKAIDLADFKSETEADDAGDLVADGNEFSGKTLAFAHAAEVLRTGASMAGAVVVFGDFSGSSTESLLDKVTPVGPAGPVHPYADVSIYGITAQIGIGDKVIGRAMIDEKGGIVILKGSGGTQAVDDPIDSAGVKNAILLLAKQASDVEPPVDIPAAPQVTPEKTDDELVDEAYKFSDATSEFKSAVVGSIGDAEYSPFLTCKSIDMAAKTHGAVVAWAMSASVMDSVNGDGDDMGEDFDPECEFDACPEWDGMEEAQA